MAADGAQSAPTDDPGPATTPWWKEAVGLIVTSALAVAVLVPALRHGLQLGAYDILEQYGLARKSGVTVQDTFKGDLITQMIPWSTLSWTQVHHGQLPLWNPYNALGFPLAFNWQSAVLSVPNLVGYLVPVRLAYTAQIIVTLIVAGTGCYAFARVARAGVLASTISGVAFAVGAPLFNWLGWPISGVLSWTGWVLAGIVLVVRGRRRLGGVVLLALSIAASVYAGEPDALVVLGFGVVAFTAAELVALRASGALPRPARAVGDLVVGSGFGVALSLPLLLPGTQLLRLSIRSQGGSALNAQAPFSWHVLLQLFLLSLGQHPSFFPAGDYLGMVPLGLAILAAIVRIKRPEVVALVVMLVVSILLFAVGPTIRLANDLPGLGAVRFPRAFILAGFSISALAGIGADALRRASASTPAQRDAATRTAGISFALFAAGTAIGAVLGFWDLTRDSVAWGSYVRRDMLWTVGTAGAGAVASALVLVSAHRSPGRSAERPRRHLQPLLGASAVLLLLVASTALLLDRGNGVFASVPSTPTAPAVRQLRAIVGSSMVGLGSNACADVDSPGILINANILYGINQFAVYDPLLPASYFKSWEKLTGGQSGGIPQYSRFCPVVATASEARTYGLKYVLEPPGGAVPQGTSFVASIAGERLYAVPRSAVVTLTSGSVHWRGMGTTHVAITTNATRASSLVIRTSAVPGWHATIDGRPLALGTVDEIMLGAQVPAGRHVISLTYWPTTFTVGLIGAALAILAGAACLVLAAVRRTSRTRRSRSAAGAEGTPVPRLRSLR